MNITRMAILGVAAIAAGSAALLVRGAMTSKPPAAQTAAAQAVATVDVLVASKEVAPGRVLGADSVRWQAWPKSAMPVNVITKTAKPDIGKAVAGMVARAPLVVGQPITDASIVHTGAIGFMAATITPGMRAISVSVTADTSAGGFILPNDRVDVVLVHDAAGGTGAKTFQSETILADVRVLAIDQTVRQEKDQQTVVGKTATLELTPEQTEVIAKAQQVARSDNTLGLALTLRSLGDSSGVPQTVKPVQQSRPIAANRPAATGSVTVYRYGVVRGAAAGPNGQPAAEGAPANSPEPTAGPVAMETSK